MRGDVIMVYKVLNGYDPSLEHLFAVDNNSVTRGQFQVEKTTLQNNNTSAFFQ